MSQYDYSVAIIAVTKVETDAVNKMYDNWRLLQMPGDEQNYYETFFKRDGSEEVHKVVFARQNEMGMTAGATLSMKLIQHFRPRYLIMVGIAAGVVISETEEQIYGDVIAADMIWNYSAGKFVSPEKSDIRFGNLGFIPRPAVIRMDERIRPYLEQAIASPENQCHVHIGPMASGSTVVANCEVLQKQIHSQFRDTAGLEMESYGVVYAATNATHPRPIPLVLKSVCDYADNQKSDQYQKFAAYTSCEFAKLLYEKYLPMSD